MANRGLLLTLDSRDPPWEYSFGERYPDHGLLGSNYYVPILWLSLFNLDGLVAWPRRDNSFPVTTLAQPTSECIERSRTRLQDWSRRWPQVFGDMAEPWLRHVAAVQDAYLAIWAQELAAGFEDAPVEFHLNKHRDDPALADVIKAQSDWQSSRAKLRAYLGCHDDPALAPLREAFSAMPSWEDKLHADLSCLDDPKSAGFRKALTEIGLQPDGRFEPNDSIGVVTAGYTAPWAALQAPWDRRPAL